MDRVTIMLAGYSNPYPWRPRMASGDGLTSLLYKAEPVKPPMARSKLTWLYSNGGIKQKTDKYERPNLTRLETFPFEYSQKDGRKTYDIQDAKLPDSNATSNVSDAIISSMLRKIWYDFHPTSGRWKKMTFKPTLDTVTENEPRNPRLDQSMADPYIAQNKIPVKKDKKTSKVQSAMKSVVNVFRRIFKKKTTQKKTPTHRDA